MSQINELDLGNEALTEAYFSQFSQSYKKDCGLFTPAKCRRGGENKAIAIRKKVYDIIDVVLVQFANSFLPGERFNKSAFVRQYFPNIKNVGAFVARYGEYINSKLKQFEELECVKKMASFSDKIKAAWARRKCRKAPVKMLESFKGFFVRVYGKLGSNTAKHTGAGWQEHLGCWGIWKDRHTGECFPHGGIFE